MPSSTGAPGASPPCWPARGIGEGDRVAVLTRNRIEFFELLLGCAKLGAILVPLNWRMPPAELDGLIADAEPLLLFHGAAEAARGRRARGRPAVDRFRRRITRPCSTPRPPFRRGPLAGFADLVPDLHLRHDRPAQGRDLHLPDGAGEPRQYRHLHRSRLDRHHGELPAGLPHRRDQPSRAADADRRRPGDRHGRLRRGDPGRPARGAPARHGLRRPHRLSEPARSSALRLGAARPASATGAAAVRLCPTPSCSATGRSACASATAWA